MKFVSIIWSNLLFRRSRTLITCGSLAMALAAVMALLGIASSFETELSRLYSSRGVDLFVQRSGGTQQLARGLPSSLAPKIRALSGVKSVNMGLVDIVAFEKHDLFNVLVNGWEADSDLMREMRFLEGRSLAAGERGKLLLGRILAANLGAHVGDSLEIYAEPFEVVGIFESSSYFENGGVVLLLDELQRLMGRSGHVTAILVSVRAPQDRAAVDQTRDEILAIERNARVESTEDYLNKEPNLRIVKGMAWATSALALLVGAIGMLNTMVMSVYERTREIGTLRAIGWRKSRVVLLMVGESLALSLGAFLLAIPLAKGLVLVVSSLPNATGLIGQQLPLYIFGQGLVMAMAIGLVGAIWPAWWGVGLSPATALHSK